MSECIACGDGADSAEQLQQIIQEKQDEQETCPECGSVKYEVTEGCSRCLDCGHSPCK